MRFLILSFIATSLIACSNSSSKTNAPAKDTVSKATVAADAPIFLTCSLSNERIAYSIDSCNCGNISSIDDTTFINLFQATGGEIQGHILKISYPAVDSSDYILMKYQNRYCTSSMGPDPVLDNWILYNSPLDTIRFNKELNGFYIDTIAEADQRRFPKFDTLDFYKAYKNAVGENLSLNYVPDIAKAALYREYTNFKNKAKDILLDSYVELHRIILVLKRSNSTERVFVFIYGHFG